MARNNRRYKGVPDGRGRFHVFIFENGRRPETLDPKVDLIDFASCGFSWGKIDENGGNQLALTLIAREIDDAKAVKLYQAFRSKHLDHLFPYEEWQACPNTIAAIVRSCEMNLAENGR